MTSADGVLEISGMHCASCGLLIDDTLEDLDGVRACATDVRANRAVVTYDPARVTPDDLVAAIAEPDGTVVTKLVGGVRDADLERLLIEVTGGKLNGQDQ